MGLLNPRASNFVFNFPKVWFYEPVVDRWKEYYKRQPLPFETVADFVNVSVQSIVFPGFSMNNVSQTKKYGKQIDWKNSKPINDLYTREITVNFAHVDGYFNYWMLQDNINYFTSFSQEKQYMENLVIRVLDNEGFIYSSIILTEVLFVSMSELELSYSSNTPDFKSFSITFSYNYIDIKLESIGSSIQLFKPL